LNKKSLIKPLVLNKDLLEFVNNNEKILDFNWTDFDNARVGYEKLGVSVVYSKFVGIEGIKYGESTVQIQTEPEIVEEFVRIVEPVVEEKNLVKVNLPYLYKNKKKEVADFVNYFKHRYDSLKSILSSRTELQESISIARLVRKQERERVSIIGLVLEKSVTKNGNIMLSLEDPTGVFKVLVMKNKEEVFALANDLVLDEVIGISGVMGNKIVFCNSLYLPEIPVNHELKKSPDETYAVFISDMHFGIKNFVAQDFMKFLKWLRGEYGNDQQKAIAEKDSNINQKKLDEAEKQAPLQLMDTAQGNFLALAFEIERLLRIYATVWLAKDIPNNINVSNLTKELRQKDLLTDNGVKQLEAIRWIRNLIVHGRQGEINQSTLEVGIQIAYSLYMELYNQLYGVNRQNT